MLTENIRKNKNLGLFRDSFHPIFHRTSKNCRLAVLHLRIVRTTLMNEKQYNFIHPIVQLLTYVHPYTSVRQAFFLQRMNCTTLESHTN